MFRQLQPDDLEGQQSTWGWLCKVIWRTEWQSCRSKDVRRQGPNNWTSGGGGSVWSPWKHWRNLCWKCASSKRHIYLLISQTWIQAASSVLMSLWKIHLLISEDTFWWLLITWQTRKWWGVHINTTKLWINQCCGEKTHKSGVPWCYIKGKTSQKKTSFILGIAQITVNIDLGRPPANLSNIFIFRCASISWIPVGESVIN